MTRAQLSSALRASDQLVDTSRTLPDSPFRSQRLAQVTFCSFDWVVSAEFGALLQDLGTRCGDESIVVTASPSPELLLLPTGRSYGALRFDAHEIGESFGPAIQSWVSDDSPPLSIVALGMVVFGSTGIWSIWADRAWDLAIVGSDRHLGDWVSGSDIWVDAQDALDHFVEPTLRQAFRTAEFRDTFLRTFGGLDK